MSGFPGGSETHLRSSSPSAPHDRDSPPQKGAKGPFAPISSPSDPIRQAKRLPIRILKMMTAHHSSHLLHPEYLQPLTSAPVSIELDAKKSPLALLAQTCSQIGKPDPPSSSKLSSHSSGASDKEASARSSSCGLKDQNHDDKSSFKPYSKVGGECRKDGVASKTSSSDKTGFRVPNNGGGGSGGGGSCQSYPPNAGSPGSSSPPLHGQAHRQSQSPSTQPPPLHADSKADQAGSDSSSSVGSMGTAGKKDVELGGKAAVLDQAQLANSSHMRASANCSSASSAGSPRPDSKATDPQPGHGHIAPVSPFKPGHSVFPLPPAAMGYHGSIVGAYAGYPSQFVPGLDHTKSSLGGLGIPGKHPSSSSPLTGASPPSLMQGLCRDPYCLTYPNAHHLGGSTCSPCGHDPSSSLKSAGGYPGLVYPSHPLHSLHPSTLASSPSLSHPLYTYGFMLHSEPPAAHACNWVSVGGPCDKRFGTSEELLAHLRTHTALPGMVDGKLLSAYPSVSSANSCHLHLPPPNSPGSLASSFSLRGSPGLGLARYHPYSKAHLPGGPLPMHSLPASSPYYSPYALYSQRLGAASALGYQ